MYNKHILKDLDFPYPLTLVLMHMSFITLYTRIWKGLGWAEVPIMGWRDIGCRFAPVALAFGASLAFANLAYLFISVAFIQMLKASMPVWVLLMSFAVGLQEPSKVLMAWIVVIFGGVLVATMAEVDIVFWGVVFQSLALGCESLRLVMINKILVSKGLNLPSIAFLYYIAPLCAMILMVPWLVVEASNVLADGAAAPRRIGGLILISNASIAFLLNLATMALIKHTSALTMNVSGVFKDFMLILYSANVDGAIVTPTQWIGYSIAAGGVAGYSEYKRRKELKKGMVPGSPTGLRSVAVTTDDAVAPTGKPSSASQSFLWVAFCVCLLLGLVVGYVGTPLALSGTASQTDSSNATSRYRNTSVVHHELSPPLSQQVMSPVVRLASPPLLLPSHPPPLLPSHPPPLLPSPLSPPPSNPLPSDEVGACVISGTSTVIGMTASNTRYFRGIVEFANQAHARGAPCVVASVASFVDAAHPLVRTLKLPLAAWWKPEEEFCDDHISGWRHAGVLKTQLMALLLRLGYDCFIIDADWTPTAAISPIIEQLRQRWDVAALADPWTDEGTMRMMNIGLLWMRNTHETRRLGERIANRTYAAWDQLIVNQEVEASSLRCCVSIAALQSAFVRGRLEAMHDEAKQNDDAQEDCDGNRPPLAALPPPADCRGDCATLYPNWNRYRFNGPERGHLFRCLHTTCDGDLFND